MADAKIRLYVDHPLAGGQSVPLTEDQARYLFAVMRLQPGALVLLFNGRDGEWLAEVAEAGKRGGRLVCQSQTRRLQAPPDLWLVFAPVKKARTDFIVEKAVELGVARILPVQTHFTNSERLRADRQQAHAVEAAEQCGATFVPEVAELQPLDRLLAGWPAGRRILWCNEAKAGVATALAGQPAGPWAILIGPEGGFSDRERAKLAALPQVVEASLGPRILRAETAALAALTLWQSALGDWK
ncbi:MULTISPECIES: 16S rRNA (uracil(1498)-N(3))-methyltransferase [Gemmobacter]|uniref:Ribosomal RNA small subunit methyltransferase E n=1 Tax=Gemmobacter caeni TaxID=589035 RepID=A0A2T6B362_9RHOB|nr:MULTISPECIES: 16S rRNA (uracil(1498)-N(3))-methyltransferase [Gemmobacter]OJY32210.1 MAG: 16S rRNA (uracil(1498)-N(3))-methyltransferase [Rhodobacterales bacterium 65-51]PTX50506.1 16S rRNA (uracil1498-N3)-methyltransferase [Gemmobacter caeni]TWI98277.1 16S rRNA (uracil1498-N3)-methyltransferase [Gemmobacter caeni]